MKYLTSIVLILLSILIFFFFTDGQYKKVQELQAQIAENKETLKIAKELNTKRKELEDKFKQISPTEKSDLEKLLPDTVDNVRLIIDIDTIATQVGILIRDIDIKSEENQDASTPRTSNSQQSVFEDTSEVIRYVDTNKIGVISFSFSVAAEYETFLDFLKQLEQSRRIVDIRNIELSRGQASEGQSKLFYDYKITFDTYWLK